MSLFPRSPPGSAVDLRLLSRRNSSDSDGRQPQAAEEVASASAKGSLGRVKRMWKHAKRPKHDYYTAIVWLYIATSAALLGTLGRADGLGLQTVKACPDTHGLKVFNLLAVQMPLAVLAGAMIKLSGFVRGTYSRVAGNTAWAPFLTIALRTTSLPLNIFSNAMFFVAQPAQDVYEVMVSETFWAGKPFDIRALNMTQFKDQAGAPEPFGTAWPEQWPRVEQLEQQLGALQENPSTWEKLSNVDCRFRYGIETQSGFGSVVLVTSWETQFESTSPRPNNNNNSALAIGALPGYQAGETSRFLALCPAAYLASTPGSFVPDSAPYLLVADQYICLGTSGPPNFCGDSNNDSAVHQSIDLCYAYRPEDGHDHGDGTWNLSQALTLQYCLSQRTRPRPTLLVFNRSTAVIFISFTSAMAIIMTAMCVVIHLSNDAPADMGLPDSGPGPSGLRWYWILLVPEWVIVMVFQWRGLVSGSKATSMGEVGTWVLGTATYANMLQVIYTFQSFIDEHMSQDRPVAKVALFVWNQLLRLYATAFVSVFMVQRYGLDDIEPPSLGVDNTSPYELVVTITTLLPGYLGLDNQHERGIRNKVAVTVLAEPVLLAARTLLLHWVSNKFLR
ncbi:hypothetical protein C8A00DRAFT_32154 [Chaetomidium leptoderma]|uniref:Uncharacterized protein n=1 Tax=Chaetomidium leptoderma TaxID=669021 RepID=A0AAN6VRF6_9PEZI|nr:hypothetical protein C8A00DRAFT_32154 [Chaetomidium leptoderma]